MPMPDGTNWNQDWTVYFQTNPSGYYGLTTGDPKYIEPFIEAITERMKACNNGLNHGFESVPVAEFWPYPNSSGSSVLQARNLPTIVPAPFSTYGYSYSTANMPVYDSALDYPTVITPPMTPAVQSYSLHDAAITNIRRNISGQTIASGLTWATLQHLVTRVARCYVISEDNNGEKIYDDLKQNFRTNHISETNNGHVINTSINPYNLFTPNVSPYYVKYDHEANDYPSGISSYVPTISRLLAEGYLLSVLPSGNELFGVQSTNKYKPYDYFIDKFPYPSGFTRKFPLEIWSVACSGNEGQVARFSTRNDVKVGGIDKSKWYGTIYGSGYNKFVYTPANERHYSGKIFKYYDTSGWVITDQTLEPDIITEYGCIVPGDYMGPWILNDLRDAINQLVWTYGIYDLDSADVVGFPGVDISNAKSTFYLHSKGINFSGNLEKTIKFGTIVGADGDDTISSTYSAMFYTESSGVSVDVEKYAYTRSSNLDYAVSSGHYAWASYNAYAYLKPFGLPYVDGVNRKFEFYGVTAPKGGHQAYPDITEVGTSGIATLNYVSYGEDVDFDPKSVVSGKIGTNGFGYTVARDNSSLNGSYFLNKIGEITTNRVGEDIGVVVGDTSLTMPVEADYALDSVGGHAYINYVCIAKWDVDGGFQYTKNTV